VIVIYIKVKVCIKRNLQANTSSSNNIFDWYVYLQMATVYKSSALIELVPHWKKCNFFKPDICIRSCRAQRWRKTKVNPSKCENNSNLWHFVTFCDVVLDVTLLSLHLNISMPNNSVICSKKYPSFFWVDSLHHVLYSQMKSVDW